MNKSQTKERNLVEKWICDTSKDNTVKSVDEKLESIMKRFEKEITQNEFNGDIDL